MDFCLKRNEYQSGKNVKKEHFCKLYLDGKKISIHPISKLKWVYPSWFLVKTNTVFVLVLTLLNGSVLPSDISKIVMIALNEKRKRINPCPLIRVLSLNQECKHNVNVV